MERITTEALSELSGPFKGKYYPLSNMTNEEQEQLIDVSVLTDRFYLSIFVLYTILLILRDQCIIICKRSRGKNRLGSLLFIVGPFLV